MWEFNLSLEQVAKVEEVKESFSGKFVFSDFSLKS